MHGSKGRAGNARNALAPRHPPPLDAKFCSFSSSLPVTSATSAPSRHGADGILRAHDRASKSDVGPLETPHPRPEADSLAQVTRKSLGRRPLLHPRLTALFKGLDEASVNWCLLRIPWCLRRLAWGRHFLSGDQNLHGSVGEW